jgi:hypothetical protein
MLYDVTQADWRRWMEKKNLSEKSRDSVLLKYFLFQLLSKSFFLRISQSMLIARGVEVVCLNSRKTSSCCILDLKLRPNFSKWMLE